MTSFLQEFTWWQLRMLSISQKRTSLPRREILTLEVDGSSAINLAKISSMVCKTDLSAVCMCVLWHSDGLGHCYGVYETTGNVLDITIFYNDNKELFFFLGPPIKYKHPTSLSSSSIHNPVRSGEKWGECLWWFRHLLASSDVPCRRIGPVVELNSH